MLRRRKLIKRCIVLVASLMLAGATPSASSPAPGVKLLVFIVVDQFAFDTLSRIRPSLTGGLARLLKEGASFDNAQHDHLVTETCPGHATLSSGDFPLHTGIVGNQFYDRVRGRLVTCTDDSEFGDSPRALLVDTLGDWIKGTTPESRVYAISSKARSAVMLGGMRANAAYWYDPTSGDFVTSAYYPAAAKSLIAGWNSMQQARRFYGTAWQPLTAENKIPAGFDLSMSRAGMEPGSFPYRLGESGGSPDSEYFDSLNRSPAIDQLVNSVAKFLIEKEGLGQRDVLDMLGVSFSALDFVGHRYGPNSPEVFDLLLRLDKELEVLFDFLDHKVGAEKIVTVLSADHGIPPLPEHLQSKGIEAQRQDAAGIACMEQVKLRLQQKFRLGYVNGLTLTDQSLKELGSRRGEYDRLIKHGLERCRGIVKVWTAADLAAPGQSVEKTRARNSFVPERGVDLLIQFSRFFATHPAHGVTHGTPYDYDTHVPLIFAGPGLSAQVISAPVRTVDVALTAAELLGVRAPEGRDGKSLVSLLKAR